MESKRHIVVREKIWIDHKGILIPSSRDKKKEVKQCQRRKGGSHEFGSTWQRN